MYISQFKNLKYEMNFPYFKFYHVYQEKEKEMNPTPHFEVNEGTRIQGPQGI